MRPLLPAAFLLLGFAAHAQADTVPDLDVEKTCRSSQVADPGVNDKASYEGCLRSEKDAKSQAEKHWSSYARPRSGNARRSSRPAATRPMSR